MSKSNTQLSFPPNKPQKNTAITNTNMPTKMDTNISQPQPAIDWESERQLVSSLAKLQELESKVLSLYYYLFLLF